MEHTAIKKIDDIKRIQVFFSKRGNLYSIKVEHFDREGYYQAHKCFTLMEASDFHSVADYYEKLKRENDLTEIY